MGTNKIRHRNPSQFYSVIYVCTCRNVISFAESLLGSKLLMQSPGCYVTKALCFLVLMFQRPLMAQFPIQTLVLLWYILRMKHHLLWCEVGLVAAWSTFVLSK